MSKFSLRKLVALGAATALGVTGFVGIAPANAVTLTNSNANVTYSGTGLKIVEGTDFNVTASINSAVSYWSETATGPQHTSAVVYKYTYQEWVDNGASAGYWTGSETYAYGPDNLTVPVIDDADPSGNYLTAVENVSAATIIKWEASSKGVISGVDATSPYNTSDTTPTFSVEAITADTDVVFTPYVSNDTDNVRDADEPQGPAITITFADYVEANWVTTLSSFRDATADDSAYITGKLTPAGTGWNLTQITDDVYMALYKNGSAAIDEQDDTLAVATSSLDADFDTEFSAVWTAKSFINDSATTNDNDAATTADRALGAVSAALTVEYLTGDARVEDVTIDDQATANITTGDVVRSGTKSLTITATLRDEYGSPVAKAGEKVEFRVDPDVDMTFNGTAVAAADGEVSVWATTNASGVATLTVGNATAEAGNDFYVEVWYYTDTEGASSESASTTYDWEDAYVWGFHETNAYNLINTVKGQNHTFNWTVTDQFGELYKDTDLRVYLSNNADADTTYVAVSNGKASYALTEQRVTGTEYTILGALFERSAPESNSWTDLQIWDTENFVVVVSNNTVGGVDAKVEDLDSDDSTRGDFSVDVNYSDFGSNNFYLNDNTFFRGLDQSTDEVVEIRGRVTNSAGVVLPGAAVELRATGQFWHWGYNVMAGEEDFGIYSENSIVVRADADGYYYANFATHKAGNNTISVTSGGKSTSVTFTVDAPNEDHADSFAVSAPKSVKAGRTINATVSVVDMFGNVVTSEGNLDYDQYTRFSAFSNRGLLVTAESIGDDEGLATYQVKVLLQPLDRGPVVIDLDWLEDEGARVTDSFAVWSGPAVNATAGAKKGRVVVEAYRSVGKTVNVFVGSTKVASFVADKANDKFVVKGLKKGNRKVSVKIASGYDFNGVISVK